MAHADPSIWMSRADDSNTGGERHIASSVFPLVCGVNKPLRSKAGLARRHSEPLAPEALGPVGVMFVTPTPHY
jgi:hypothetical protein